VIADVLYSNGIEIGTVFDEDEKILSFEGKAVLHSGFAAPLLLCIGNNANRKKVAQKLPQDIFAPPAIAAGSIVSTGARIGQGSVVMQGATVQTAANIGRHCIVNTGANIDHECRISDFVHIAPGATLCGNVEVGEGTLVGAGSVVIPGIKIGKWATIGAGSVVVSDIPDFATAYGNPCKIKK